MNKQETLEEVAEKRYGTLITNPKKNITVDIHGDLKIGFVEGAKSDAAKDYWYAKWHEERMYSKFDLDAEITKLNTPHRYDNVKHKYNYSESDIVNLFEKWFEQSKKK